MGHDALCAAAHHTMTHCAPLVLCTCVLRTHRTDRSESDSSGLGGLHGREPGRVGHKDSPYQQPASPKSPGRRGSKSPPLDANLQSLRGSDSFTLKRVRASVCCWVLLCIILAAVCRACAAVIRSPSSGCVLVCCWVLLCIILAAVCSSCAAVILSPSSGCVLVCVAGCYCASSLLPSADPARQ